MRCFHLLRKVLFPCLFLCESSFSAIDIYFIDREKCIHALSTRYLFLLIRHARSLKDAEVLCQKERISISLIDEACAFGSHVFRDPNYNFNLERKRLDPLRIFFSA